MGATRILFLLAEVGSELTYKTGSTHYSLFYKQKVEMLQTGGLMFTMPLGGPYNAALSNKTVQARMRAMLVWGAHMPRNRLLRDASM